MFTHQPILVSAYALSPYRGSEASVGWNYVQLICHMNEGDIHVICEEKSSKLEVEKFLHNDPNAPRNLIVHYIKKRTFPFGLDSRSKSLYYLRYGLWQWEAYRYARELHKNVKFGWVHQLNMVGFREPGFLWRMNIPFIWGPVGGTDNIELKLARTCGFNAYLSAIGYNAFNTFQKKFNVRFHLALRKINRQDGGLISATASIQRFMLKQKKTKSITLNEVGITQLKNRECIPCRHFIWAGNLRQFKGLKLLLKAWNQAELGDGAKLHIFGAGSDRSVRRYKKMCRDNSVLWHGALPREKYLGILKSVDCAIITSMKDLTSNVICEFIEAGLPVIFPKANGFPDFFTKDYPGMIEIRSPAQVQNEYVQLLHQAFLGNLPSNADVPDVAFWSNRLIQLRRVYESVAS